MLYRLEFEIPKLPRTLNARGHWRVKHKENMAWREMVSLMTVGKRPESPLEKAKLTLTRRSSIEPDFDNLVSGFKPIVDALVHCGVLLNDKPSNIGGSEYLWEKAKVRQGGVRVLVETPKGNAHE